MERVVQFETKQKTSPGIDMYSCSLYENRDDPAARLDDYTGVAWLSSARAVRCSIKLGNECNPYPMLNIHWRLRRDFATRREGRTSSQHDPYTLGYTHPTMAKNNGLQARKCKLIPEISPQFRLGSETRPHEVGIGSNRRSAGCGEYVLGSCTHRPSNRRPKIRKFLGKSS